MKKPKPKYKTPAKASKMSEPEAVYEKKGLGSITVSTFNEQEESNYRYWLSLSPEERWAEHYNLLQRFYNRKTISTRKDNRIIFDT